MPQVDRVKSIQQKRLRKVVVLVVLGLAVVAGAAYVYVSWLHSRVTVNDLSKVEDQASAAANSSGTQAGLNVYEAALKNASNNVVRANLDMDAGDMADNNGMDATALVYALKAEKIFGTADSSAFVAYIYNQQGNKAQAVAYYQKAASEVKPNQLGGNSKEYYLAEAKYVAGGGQ